MYRLLLGVLMLALFGCASPGVIRLYSGPELAPAELAQMEIPVAIDLLAIDGRKISQTMQSTGWRRYQLKPGEHEVLLKYEQLWRDEENEPVVIRSPAVVIRWIAEAGRVYRLQPEMPASLAAAEAFRDDFRVWLQNDQGERFDSRPLPLSQQPLSLTERLFEPDSGQALEQLKYWWTHANEDERQRFLEYLDAP